MRTIFAFDLDGTLTEAEVLPVIANELGLMDEMKSLTEITLSGLITFEASFRLRIAILKSIPVSKVQEIVSEIPLHPALEKFVQSHKDQCAVITGNLDVWVSPLLEKLGCRVFSSHSIVNADQLCGVEYIMHKSQPIRELKSEFEKVVCIGESMNDIPMFEVADSGIAFGGVHDPVKELIEISDYVVFDGESLCRLLNTL
jgi:HAD superfamily phosphoserine phosphatase-like hydrolase